MSNLTKLIDEAGKWQRKYVSTGLQNLDQSVYKRGIPYNPMTPTITGVFGACGARQMVGMSACYLLCEEARQEWVCALDQNVANKMQLYFLPTTSQMKTYKDHKGSVLNLLFRLGAKEVFNSPNRLHGPNNLHLCVLDMGSKEYLEKKAEFLVKYKIKDYYGYERTVEVPRYLLGTPEEPKPAQKPKGPARDAFGRFVKVVIR